MVIKMEEIKRNMNEIFKYLSINMQEGNYTVFGGVFDERKNILICELKNLVNFQKGDMIKRDSTKEIFMISNVVAEANINILKIYLEPITEDYFPIVWAKKIVYFVSD